MHTSKAYPHIINEVRAFRERKKRSVWFRELVENCVVYGDRGFNLVRFCDLLEEEIRALLLYRSLKDPEKVMRVEDFHKKPSDCTA